MPLPTYEEFIDPILRVPAEKPEGMRAAEVHDVAAERLGLTDEQLRTLLNSGQLMYRNRAGWAYDRIKRAGFADTAQRGIWRLNSKGLAYVKEHPNPLNHPGNRGGCLVKVKQVPQPVLQVVDSNALRLRPAGYPRSIPADAG